MSDEDIEMGTIVLPSSNNPSSKIPALALTPPKTALANNFITGAGASSKSSLANPLVSIQKQHSVKFDMGPPLTSPGMNIYRKEVDPDEGDDIRSSANSTSNLRGAFSRQPSYRESTIIDSSCGGRDTIKVLTSNKLGPLDQKPENASGTSTRQNSGGMYLQYRLKRNVVVFFISLFSFTRSHLMILFVCLLLCLFVTFRCGSSHFLSGEKRAAGAVPQQGQLTSVQSDEHAPQQRPARPAGLPFLGAEQRQQ